MATGKFPFKLTLEAALIHSFSVVFIGGISLIMIGVFKHYMIEINETWIGVAFIVGIIIVAFFYNFLTPKIYNWFYPQRIKCEYIPIDKQASTDENHPYQIKVEKMYEKLTELTKSAKSIKIVDNTHSQLDHLTADQTAKRTEFHLAVMNRLKEQGGTFHYNRIELFYDQTKTKKSEDIYKSIDVNYATKKHIDEVMKFFPKASVQYLSTPTQIGTFIIVDSVKIIFQIDGVEFENQVPSDLIILTVSNPEAALLKNYLEKFEILTQRARPHSDNNN
ncbi:hypothetical protein BH11BAC7_BH11BAC7_05580 [soil metagenome]